MLGHGMILRNIHLFARHGACDLFFSPLVALVIVFERDGRPVFGK
jgi:hypothetical protein